MSHGWARSLKLAVVLALLVIATVQLPWQGPLALDVHWPLLSVSLVLFLTWQYSICARWRYCLGLVRTGRPLPPQRLIVKIICIGNLVTLAVLPSFVGQDISKMVYWRSLSDSMTEMLHSVVMTRAAGLLGIVLCGVPCLGSLGAVLQPAVSYGEAGGVPFLWLATAGLCCLVGGLLLALSRRLRQLVLGTLSAMRRLPLLVVGMGVGSQLLYIATTALVVLGVATVPVADLLPAISAAALGRLIPLSIVGLTAGEGILTVMLLELGVSWQEIQCILSLHVAFVFLLAVSGFVLELFPMRDAGVR